MEMDTKDMQKTTFTVERGHYEYIRMLFDFKMSLHLLVGKIVSYM